MKVMYVAVDVQQCAKREKMRGKIVETLQQSVVKIGHVMVIFLFAGLVRPDVQARQRDKLHRSFRFVSFSFSIFYLSLRQAVPCRAVPCRCYFVVTL